MSEWCNSTSAGAARRPATFWLLIATALGWSCGARTPPPAPVPVAPGARLTACADPPARAWVLAVDASPERRAALMAGLERGVALVRYDCTSIALLDACSATGDYTYLSSTPEKRELSLSGPDEVAGNLPFRGREVASSLGHGQGLWIEATSSGARVASRDAVPRGDLRGECGAATHFVKSAMLGAYVVRTGAAQGAVVAPPVSAPSAGQGGSGGGSAGSVVAQGGDAARCADRGSGEAAIAGCDALLSLELVAVSEAGAGAAPRDVIAESIEAPRCAAPLVFAGGACRFQVEGRPHACEYGRAVDCRVQCQSGDRLSCARLGLMHERGDGVSQSPSLAREAYEKACRDEEALACVRFARLLLEDESDGVDASMALELYRRACGAGHVAACRAAVRYYEERAAEDAAPLNDSVQGLLDRACRGGDVESCVKLASALEEGSDETRDTERAAALAKQACDRGDQRGCSALAAAYLRGVGVAKDPARAAQLYTQACATDHMPACGMLGTMALEGAPGAPEPVKGLELLERACGRGDAASCFALALRYEKGDGVLKDKVRARSLFERACRDGFTPACQ